VSRYVATIDFIIKHNLLYFVYFHQLSPVAVVTPISHQLTIKRRRGDYALPYTIQPLNLIHSRSSASFFLPESCIYAVGLRQFYCVGLGTILVPSRKIIKTLCG